jgi:photosystem II stability/assembly factor-like uncharacterized protein
VRTKILDVPGIFCILILDIHTLNLKEGGVMRFVKEVVLIGVLFLSLGALLLLWEGKADPVDQPQLEKPTMWGDDVLVHDGYVSRFSRNGYSSDYDEDSNHIYVAVSGYSSGPDTCWLYRSTNGGTNWTLYSFWPYSVDISNPQVVVGKGSNYYLFWFGRTNENNGDIVLYRKPLPAGSWTQYTIGGTSGYDIRNFAATGEQGSVYNLHIAYDSDSGKTYYLRSNTYGTSWTYYDTLDGDQPHLVTGGLDGAEELYLTWRMDGENGALCGVKNQEFFIKGLNMGEGKWNGPLLPFSAYGGGVDSTYCMLQASDGTIYVGVEDADSDGDHGRIFKSTDGGRTWSIYTLAGTERVLDLMEASGTMWAATGEKARVFRYNTGDDTWYETGSIGGAGDINAYCLATRLSTHIYVGTGDEGDVFKSTNSGADWNELPTDIPGADRIYSLIVTEAGTILAGAYKEGDSIGIFRSPDDGVHWTEKRPAGVKWVSSLFQASDDTIYAAVFTNFASNKSRVLKSTDDGATWIWTTYQAPGSEGFGEVPWSIMEDSEGAIYVANSGDYVKKTTDHGSTWSTLTNWYLQDIRELIQSRPQIMVKKSTNRGVSWQAPKKISLSVGRYSDPKVAATQGSSSYIVWVAYSKWGEGTALWSLPYAYSTDKGLTWIQPAGSLAAELPEQPLCDLRVKRGYNYVHAAYSAHISGSRKVYYQYSHSSHPDSWSDTVCISSIIPTSYHTPEISFYQNNTLIFFCGQTFTLPPQHPNDLYVDASHFTGVDEEEEELSLPNEFSLSQNYPNPFNPTTSIRFTVRGSPFAVYAPIRTTLRIYNVLGEAVRTLVDETKNAGSYEVIWDGKDNQGKEVASGIYFCKLQVGDKSQTKNMVLIK